MLGGKIEKLSLYRMKLILIDNKGNVITEYFSSPAIDITYIKDKFTSCVRVVVPEVGIDLAI